MNVLPGSQLTTEYEAEEHEHQRQEQEAEHEHATYSDEPIKLDPEGHPRHFWWRFPRHITRSE